ncbi:MAG: lysophospholipid acyltransferase family protein [Holophaga sp.]|nr:lysophospholipid acyltransferase family protein [Holophaga sp.]
MHPFRNLFARLHQGRKILVSGLLFALLGLGGAVLSFLVVPVLRLLPGGREGLRNRAGWLIRRSFRLFVFAMEASGILRVEARLPGPERLAGALVLCNHPSYLDVVVLVALLPQALCVVKGAVYRSFFFGGLVRAAGYVPSAGVLEAGRDALRRGKTLILFPEGTRSRPGQPIKFRRGAAYLARSSGARILPLVLSCTPGLLGKGHRWYHVPIETCRFRVRAGGPPPFEVAPVASGTPHLAARQMIEALEHYYDKETHAPH